MKINRQVVYLVSSIILILLALASAFLGGWIPAQYTYGFIGLTFLFCALSQWELYRDNGKTKPPNFQYYLACARPAESVHFSAGYRSARITSQRRWYHENRNQF